MAALVFLCLLVFLSLSFLFCSHLYFHFSPSHLLSCISFSFHSRCVSSLSLFLVSLGINVSSKPCSFSCFLYLPPSSPLLPPTHSSPSLCDSVTFIPPSHNHSFIPSDMLTSSWCRCSYTLKITPSSSSSPLLF